MCPPSGIICLSLSFSFSLAPFRPPAGPYPPLEIQLNHEPRAKKVHKPGLGAAVRSPPPKSKIAGIWKGGAQRTHEMRISGWGNRAEGWGLLEGEPLDGRAQCLCPTGRGWGWAQCGGRSAPQQLIQRGFGRLTIPGPSAPAHPSGRVLCGAYVTP